MVNVHQIFSELHIDSNLNFGRIISLNVELGILLISQLEKLYFTAKDSNCSLDDLVDIIDLLFVPPSSSLPVLKELTLNVDGHPNAWLSAQHLVDQIGIIFRRFPKLIHFTLYCRQISAFEGRKICLLELIQNGFLSSLLSRTKKFNALST